MEVYCIVKESVRLSKATRKIQLNEPLAYNNAFAHAMQVEVYNDDGTAADLSTFGVTAAFKRSDNQTVEPINGTVDGNIAQVILPPSCYVAPGRFVFTMNLTKPTPTTGIDAFSTSVDYSKGDLCVYSGVVYRFTATHSAGAWTGNDAVPDAASRTVLWVNGIAERNTTDTIVDPGTPVGNISQAIGNANAAAAAATSAASSATTAADSANAAATNALGNFAGAFDATAAYAAGTYVTYTDGKMYLLPNGHEANVTWANTTKTVSTAGGELATLKSAVDENYSHITTGDFVPPLEIGDYDISGGSVVPKDRKYYVRTSSPVALRAGDTITLSTLSGYAYYVLAKYSGTDSWVLIGVKYTKFTVLKDGEYHITIRENPEDSSIVYTKPSDLGITPIIHDTYSIAVRLSNVEAQIEPTENVQNNFTLSGGRLYNYYGQFPKSGTFTINRIPANTRVGLQGYSDDRYATKVFDSGWITNVQYSTSVNPKLFYMVMIANYDYSAITDISVGDDFSLIYEYDLDDSFSATDRAIKSREPWQLLTVKSIAHRGETIFAPQCTEPAYIYAAKNGFRYAENDVNVSSDGELVMWHDTSLERLGNLVDINGYEIYTDNEILYYYDTSTAKLYTYTTQYVESAMSVSSLTRCNGENYRTRDLTLAELKRIDFGRYVSLAFAGTTILTFAEWVLVCKKLGLGLYIDAKISYTSANVEEMVETIKLYGMGDYVTWININTTAEIELIRTYDTKSRILALITPTAQNVSDFMSYADGKFGYDSNGRTLTAEQAELALSNGYLLEAYYVDTGNYKRGTVYNEINSLLGIGVQGLTLDTVRIEDAIQFLYM